MTFANMHDEMSRKPKPLDNKNAWKVEKELREKEIALYQANPESPMPVMIPAASATVKWSDKFK